MATDRNGQLLVDKWDKDGGTTCLVIPVVYVPCFNR